MTTTRRALALRSALLFATALASTPTLADDGTAPAGPAAPSLETQFQDPPNSARPRVWWHWMNGNISKDGIAKDFAWMKRVGIGGMQNFDANLQTPKLVDHRLVYMTPEWKDAFRFAATEADRLGLELAIAASPGWSETGGPWVPPQDGLKKLVWSETTIVGGKPFKGVLPALPSKTGPFQTAGKPPGINEAMSGEAAMTPPSYLGEVWVLAIPLVASVALDVPVITGPDGKVIDATVLSDGDLMSALLVAKSGKNPAITLAYPKPQTVQSASVFLPGSAVQFMSPNVLPRLESSSDGKVWTKIADLPVTMVPTTVSFAAVTAPWFRVVLAGVSGGGLPLTGMAEGLDFSNMGSLGAGLGDTGIKVGDLRLFAEAKVDRFEAKAGFTIEPDYYALSKGLADQGGAAPAGVIDITAMMKPDGTLEWTPPKGTWRVLRMGYSLLGTTNHPAPPEATGLEVDKFDGDAVKRYMDHYIGMYKDAAGANLVGARGVQAILTDSIEVGAANWTPKMVERFTALRGYDPSPWLPALTGTIIGSRAQSDAFLYDYRRTLADLMASEHYGVVAKVAHANGLKVYGEALEDRRPSLGDDMAMRRHADIPMAAMWTHTRKDGPRITYLADIKGAASVAHIYGQNLVAAESMTAFMSPWAYGPADLKRVIDLEFVTGVNRPVVHTSVHAPVDDKKPGLTLWIFGQYFNRNEAWAELAKPWVDYMSRHSLLLQQGRNVADVGYFYGEESPLTGLYSEKAVADAPVTNAYDFVNSDALNSALQNDGNELVAPGGARYRALYLGGSSHKMTLGTLRRLAALVEGGATVVGQRPDGDPGLSGNAAEQAALLAKLWPGGASAQVGKGRVIASNDIHAALKEIGVAADFRFTGASEGAAIPFLHRKLADGDSYFVNNRSNAPQKITAHFRVTGKVPELWRAETGTSLPLSYTIANGETVVPLDLALDDAVHVVFRKAATATALTVTKPAELALGTLDAPWTVRFQAGRGAPEMATFAKLAPLNENTDPAIKYFSGEAIYEQEFKAPKGWKPGQALWLDLGEAREVAEVTVNGKQAGFAWHAPYRIDISDQMKKGKNRVSIRVANLWVNRMIGDAQPGATKVAWFSGPGYTKSAPMRKSGLIGPVTLVGEVKR